MITIIYGYNKWGACNVIILISAGPTEEPYMKERKSMVELTQIVQCSLRIVWMSPSARRRVSHAHKHVRILRTKDEARASIIFKQRRLYSYSASWPHLVSMRL